MIDLSAFWLRSFLAVFAAQALLSCSSSSDLRNGDSGSGASGLGDATGDAVAGTSTGGTLAASGGGSNPSSAGALDPPSLGGSAGTAVGAAEGGSAGTFAMGGTTAGAGGHVAGTGGTNGGQAGSSGSAGAAGAVGNGGYSPCPAASTPCKVLPFGDSITYGFGSTDKGGYRSALFKLAVAGAKSLTFVGGSADGPDQVSGKPFPKQHEGHPSYTIDDRGSLKGIAPLVRQGVVKTYQPHIVLLMIGTNDIANNVDLANAPERLGKLIDSIIADAPAALVVVAKITPSLKSPANANTQTYNSAIAGVVSARVAQGKHVRVVDMYASFVANNYSTKLMHDSVHPNDAGYVTMADTWYPAIRELLH